MPINGRNDSANARKPRAVPDNIMGNLSGDTVGLLLAFEYF